MADIDNITQFANQAQDISRSAYGAMQGIAEVQLSILQRMGEVQQNMVRQAYEVTSEQLQLATRVRDPREFASAQAELVKTQGQRYADSIKQAVDITVEAWNEYGDRLEQGVKDVESKTQRAASSKKAA